MASAKFLEEALSTDVDESAVSAIVGSLETQLVTSTPAVSNQQGTTVVLNQNHINSAISNGASTTIPSQKHEGVANGESMNVLHSEANKSVSINSTLQQSSITSTNVSQTAVSNSLQAQVAASTYHLTEGTATNNTNIITHQTTNITKSNNDTVKLIYPQGNPPSMTSTAGAIITNRVAFPAQTVPNGSIGLSPLTPHTVQSKQSSAIVIKTSGGNHSNNAPGLVSVPMSSAASIQQQQHINSVVCSSTAASAATLQNIMTLAKPMSQTVVSSQNLVHTSHQQQQTAAILPSNVQILNVRQGHHPQQQQQQQQKTGTAVGGGGGAVQSRVVLSAPQMVGARPGQPQITLQSLQGLQPGQQGHLLLKTENGQYQLLRVGPAPAAPGTALPTNATPAAAAAAAGTTTYRLQTVPAVSRLNTQFAGPPLTLRKTIVQQPNSVTPTPTSSPAPVQVQQTVATVTAAATVSSAQSTNTVPVQQRQNLDNTKEKCRKFLANLLELSSREPKSVERNVRTLIQELIDCKVEPEEFCDRLERLLNASPQPCLIGFLKKSLPLLRQSLVTKELTIDGIRPPPANVVYSIQNATAPTLHTQQVRAQATATQVRIVAPAAAAVVRPTMQQRLVTTPIRGQSPQPPRMIATTTALRQQLPTTSPVIVSTSQPPALHPVFPQTANHQARTTVNVVRPPIQVRTAAAAPLKQQTAVRTSAPPVQVKPTLANRMAAGKPSVPSTLLPKPSTTATPKEKKSFSSAGGYTGDDDINDVAAMGGVNLAEETQRILGSTEFVGTQIRSCKDEVFLHLGALQQKLRQAAAKHGLDDPGSEVAALISHAAQEHLKNVVEKLAVITDHRVDILKNDPRYEVTQDVKGQLKFLEELDRAERKRHEEQEREMLLRAAKSRSKSEDPEQAKLKAKAKEMQRVELEELRQREANATALQAIGPRKKQRLDGESIAGSSQNSMGGASGSGTSRGQLPLRQRMKKVTLRDLLFLMETEKNTCRSPLLYKSYLK